MTLRRQMILQIAGPALVIYVVILGLAAAAQYRQSQREVEHAATRLATSYSSRLDGYLREASHIAETTAKLFESNLKIPDDEVFNLLENNVERMPLVYGSCLAFEPGTRRPVEELFGPYVYRSPDGIRRMIIDRQVYDWYRDPAYTWYSRPKSLGHGVWSPPYFDAGAGNILMTTYSAPFRAGDKFGGVCTVDIDLPRLRETVGHEIDERLDFVILDSEGRYVFHPDASRIMAKTLFEYPDQSGGKLAQIGPEMLSGTAGAAWLPGWETSDPVGVFYAPIPSTGWVFVSRIPAEAVLGDVRRRTIQGGLAFVAALMLIGGTIWFVAGRLTSPITALERQVTEVSRGNLEAQVQSNSATHEIRTLAQNFNRMTADLRANVERLAVEKAERKRIERDLDIAREIQQSLLPTSKPELAEYDIAGWSQSAEKTGGDYYDWQQLPDGRMLISLADVTGHGIGPALVAAVCRAYSRASANSNGHDLSRFMSRLNKLISDDLIEGRFVTFAGVLLDPTRHEALMLSAGHGPLFRCHAARGELVEFEADDLPLGLVDDMDYSAPGKHVMEPGDFILLVTDGLFEWSNPAGENFGLPRLREAIRSVASGSAEEIIRGLYEQASAFAAPLSQVDDVTIVVIRRC